MKKLRIICLTVMLFVFLSGCQKREGNVINGTYLLYANMDGTRLNRVEYTIKETMPEDAVRNMLDKLSEAPKDVELVSAMPKDVRVENFVLENKILHLYMSPSYEKMDEVQEVLLRAALVQCLSQISQVEAIDMFVGDKPLLTKEGVPVGLMDEESFVRNTGTALKSLHKSTFQLYFVNKSRDSLVTEEVDVRYFGDAPTEELVVKELLKGPKGKDKKAVLSPEIKLLSTSVKDGVCYVNFSKEFLTHNYEIGPELVVYGVVNSVVSNCDVSMVQITVEGDASGELMGKVDISEPFVRNIELVENE